MSKQKIINIIKSIILKYSNPKRVYLYGSYATGEATSSSDIDIAFDDENCTKENLIKEEIEQIETLIKIDVKNLNNCEDRFVRRVKTTGKVLYSATKELRAEDALYNFNNALNKFIDVINREKELQDSGNGDIFLDIIIKRFEFTFETSWKALKRYLDFIGIDAKSPRMVFKEAYAQGIIKEEGIWLDMIEQRNLSSHVYDEFEVNSILEDKNDYKQAFIDLKNELSKQLNRVK